MKNWLPGDRHWSHTMSERHYVANTHYIDKWLRRKVLERYVLFGFHKQALIKYGKDKGKLAVPELLSKDAFGVRCCGYCKLSEGRHMPFCVEIVRPTAQEMEDYFAEERGYEEGWAEAEIA